MGEFFEMQEDGILNQRGEYIGPRPKKGSKLIHYCSGCRRGFGTEQGFNDHNRVKHKQVIKREDK